MGHPVHLSLAQGSDFGSATAMSLGTRCHTNPLNPTAWTRERNQRHRTFPKCSTTVAVAPIPYSLIVTTQFVGIISKAVGTWSQATPERRLERVSRTAGGLQGPKIEKYLRSQLSCKAQTQKIKAGRACKLTWKPERSPMKTACQSLVYMSCLFFKIHFCISLHAWNNCLCKLCETL